MKESRTKLALFLWFSSRIWIIFFQAKPYNNDLQLFYILDHYFLEEGKRWYLEIPFPYPPLAIPPYLLPAMLMPRFPSYASYWQFFQGTMFFCELALLGLILAFAKKLQFQDKERSFAILLLCFFGLTQSHLIYDRLDIGTGAFLLAMLYLWCEQKKPFALIATATTGFFYKIIPLLFLPFPIAQKMQEQAKWSRKILVGTLGVTWFLPSILGFLILEMSLFPGLKNVFFEHANRGIQIESIWASPWLLWKALIPNADVQIASNLGAFEVTGAWNTAWLANLAKYSGVPCFLALLLRLACLKQWPEQKKSFALLTLLVFLFTFLLTQRVLSPQFLLWLVPALSLWLPMRKKAWEFILPALFFLLTTVVFPYGYGKLLQFQPALLWALILRNILLFIYGAHLIRLWWKESRQLLT